MLLCFFCASILIASYILDFYSYIILYIKLYFIICNFFMLLNKFKEFEYYLINDEQKKE